jgi:hypothetical protein
MLDVYLVMRQIALKPQDIVVALKIALIGSGKRTFAHLANELAMPASEVHASTHRSEQAGIITTSLGDGLNIIKPALREFLVHGVRYAFPAVFGGIARGVPTASGGPSLSKLLTMSDEGPPVWPYVAGEARGPALCPLYPKAPAAAAKDPAFYDFLTLIDAMRVGGARDREIAKAEVEKRLK